MGRATQPACTGDWKKRGLDGRSDERMAPGPCGCGVQRSPAPGSMPSRRTRPSARGCDAPPRLERRASKAAAAGAGDGGKVSDKLFEMAKRTLHTYFSGSSSTSTPDTNDSTNQPIRRRVEFSQSDVVGDPGNLVISSNDS